VSGMVKSIQQSSYLIGIQTRALPACSIVPQRTALQCVPLLNAKTLLKYINLNKTVGSNGLLSLP
jgi:hypothetical protein